MAKFKNAIRKHYIAAYDQNIQILHQLMISIFGSPKVSKNLHQRMTQKMMTLLISTVTVLKKKSSLLNLVVVHSKDTVTMVIKLKTLLLIKKTL